MADPLTHSHDTATPALSVESEYVLVPREPTPGMVDAGRIHGWDDPDHEGSCIGHPETREAIYRAMIAAAPAPNPSPAAKGGEALPDVRLDSEKAEEWPAVQKALWRVVTGENLNDGHYINAYRFTEKLYAAITALATPSPQPANAVRDCLPAGHVVLEQADMMDGTGRVAQTVSIGPEGAPGSVEYQRIVHADEAYGDVE